MTAQVDSKRNGTQSQQYKRDCYMAAADRAMTDLADFVFRTADQRNYVVDCYKDKNSEQWSCAVQLHLSDGTAKTFLHCYLDHFHFVLDYELFPWEAVALIKDLLLMRMFVRSSGKTLEVVKIDADNKQQARRMLETIFGRIDSVIWELEKTARSHAGSSRA